MTTIPSDETLIEQISDISTFNVTVRIPEHGEIRYFVRCARCGGKDRAWVAWEYLALDLGKKAASKPCRRCGATS